MAKSADTGVLDAGFEKIKTGVGTVGPCNQQVLCGTEPTTYTQAQATYMLAAVTMATGDFTIAADTSGEKCTVTAKSNVTVTNPGTANWVCLIDTVNSKLLAKTSCTAKALTDTVDIAAWVLHNPQPV